MPRKAKTSEFEKKPIPWLYTGWGSVLGIALMKLHPIHRSLGELEIQNLRDYFTISKQKAFWMTYWGAIRRILTVSRKARQDYYALNRKGTFAISKIEAWQTPPYPSSPHLPLLIVPGLNTPSAFFREMSDYFLDKGYNVSVFELPERGFAEVSQAAEALDHEIQRLKQICKTSQVNIVGHCLGGIIAKVCVESQEVPTPNSVQHVISLGTGFLGADGVLQLKNLWIPRNPGKPIPKVFDELIHWNLNSLKNSTAAMFHSVLTIWDFMVHFKKGLLLTASGTPVHTEIIEDPAIDHLTLALHPSVFQKIEHILQTPPSTPHGMISSHAQSLQFCPAT